MLEFLRDLFRGSPAPDRDQLQALADEAPEVVVELAREGRQLDAIREYRRLTGCNLRLAHAVVKWLGPNRSA